VYVSVRYDDVAFLRNGRKRTQVSLEPGTEHQRGLPLHEARERFFERHVQVHCAVEHARAGAARSVQVYSFFSGSFDFRISGKSEVVVRAEHEDAPVAHHHFGLARICSA